MYLLTTSHPFPTLPWKQLGAHICSSHHSLRWGNSFLSILLVLPFSLLAIKLSEYFGGYLKNIWTWSGFTAISIISISSSYMSCRGCLLLSLRHCRSVSYL